MIVNGIEVKQHPFFADYAISKCGQVYSIPRINSYGKSVKAKWLKKGTTKYGHHLVVLRKGNKSYSRLVHTLVLETYRGFCPVGLECRHLDGNPANNNLSNLCWGTHQENMMDRDRHGTTPHTKGEQHGKTPLSGKDVRMIIYMYRTGLFTQRELGNIYGISGQSVSAIINKKSWRHLWAN